jgi:hypothetical protein
MLEEEGNGDARVRVCMGVRERGCVTTHTYSEQGYRLGGSPEKLVRMHCRKNKND